MQVRRIVRPVAPQVLREEPRLDVRDEAQGRLAAREGMGHFFLPAVRQVGQDGTPRVLGEGDRCLLYTSPSPRD